MPPEPDDPTPEWQPFNMSSDVVNAQQTLLDRVLADALADKGLGRGSYAYFLTSPEGKPLPLADAIEPIEEYSITGQPRP